MRIAILILAFLLGVEATAQEQPPARQPLERPVEETLDGASTEVSSEDSPDAARQALWESATKLKFEEESDAPTSSPATATSAHALEECLDPSKFEPGQVGYLDYYLFKVADIEPHDLYLESEQSKEPFCLTNVDTEDLKKAQLVVVLGYVLVRGTKTYKTEEGDKATVRVVKLLSPKESEFADTQRALQESNNPVRTWTSKDGMHKIEARFSKFAGGKVYLVNSSGKTITISPNALSVEDREYYRELIKKARDAARKTKEKDDDDKEQESEER